MHSITKNFVAYLIDSGCGSIPSGIFYSLYGPASAVTLTRDISAEYQDMPNFLSWLTALKDIFPRVLMEDIGEQQDVTMCCLRKIPEVCAFNKECSRLLNGERCLFFTYDNFIGSCALGAQQGDKIALIQGVQLPMILRQIDSEATRYSVAGPGYVAGYFAPWSELEKFETIELV